MPKSTLITNNEIREFVGLCKTWTTEEALKKYWGEVRKAEPHLFAWLDDWIQSSLKGDERIVALKAAPAAVTPLGTVLLELFLAGMWFGERRWAGRMGDVFAGLGDS